MAAEALSPESQGIIPGNIRSQGISSYTKWVSIIAADALTTYVARVSAATLLT